MTARTSTPPAVQWESLKQASARTGYGVGSLRDQINMGRLPAYRLNDKPGAEIRVKAADVDALFVPFLADPFLGGAK